MPSPIGLESLSVRVDVFPKFQPRDSRLPHGKRAQFSSPTHV